MLNSKLKITLFEQGLTQEQLSQKTGIPRVYISQAIRGRLNLTAAEKKKIANVVKREIEDLF